MKALVCIVKIFELPMVLTLATIEYYTCWKNGRVIDRKEVFRVAFDDWKNG